MANVSSLALRKAWNEMRKAGGSIFSHTGENLTGPHYQAGHFVNYVNNLCSHEEEFVADVIDEVYKAIEDAERQVVLNENAAIKCYSKPVVKLHIGCKAERELVARNGTEENCADGT
ncbi:MAG TPA: hypothetical protein VF727_14575 [Allosphingosinicella sp.]|jgi:hypothetical protein